MSVSRVLGRDRLAEQGCVERAVFAAIKLTINVRCVFEGLRCMLIVLCRACIVPVH